MVHKVRCNVTGNIVYMTEGRYARMLAKYGGAEGVKNNYVSLLGKRIRDGIIEEPKQLKNRIKCTITGKWCYITNQRIEAGVKKYGSWEELCNNYICRPAARLLREGKTVDEIKQMVVDGTFPEK